jgi:hypothetical protein
VSHQRIRRFFAGHRKQRVDSSGLLQFAKRNRCLQSDSGRFIVQQRDQLSRLTFRSRRIAQDFDGLRANLGISIGKAY